MAGEDGIRRLLQHWDSVIITEHYVLGLLEGSWTLWCRHALEDFALRSVTTTRCGNYHHDSTKSFIRTVLDERGLKVATT